MKEINSSQFRRILFFIFISTLLFLSFFYFLSIYPIFLHGGKYFYGDKVLKSFHMKKKLEKKKVDIVFLGSSKTENQTSTKLFEDKGVQIYNYGIGGLDISDFPYPISEVISIGPKIIVLSIHLKDLYYGILIKYPTLHDTFFFNNKGLSYKYTNKHHFPDYFLRLRPAFGKTKFIIASYFHSHPSLHQKKWSEQQDFIDCDIAEYHVYSGSHVGKYNLGERSSVYCTNGDLISFAHVATIPPGIDFSFVNKEPDSIKVKALNQMIITIKEQGILPIIILEPWKYNKIYHPPKDFNFIQTPVINLVNFKVKDRNLWADHAHFNAQGRLIYSQKLYEVLKEFIPHY